MLITELRLSRLSNALPKAERGTAPGKIDFSGPRRSLSILASSTRFGGKNGQVAHLRVIAVLLWNIDERVSCQRHLYLQSSIEFHLKHCS